MPEFKVAKVIDERVPVRRLVGRARHRSTAVIRPAEGGGELIVQVALLAAVDLHDHEISHAQASEHVAEIVLSDRVYEASAQPGKPRAEPKRLPVQTATQSGKSGSRSRRPGGGRYALSVVEIPHLEAVVTGTVAQGWRKFAG